MKENPYTIHQELQETMQDLVGIIRVEGELKEALDRIAALSSAQRPRCRSKATAQYNPGWHLALDLRNMLLVSEAVARAALERQESRGGHTRDDYPMTDPFWSGQNVVLALGAASTSSPSHSALTVRRQALPKPPPELAELLEEVH